MPKCVVYTFAYNAERTLERTVHSVLNQTYGEFEYHLVDNGSTDRTGKIIASFARRDPRIVASTNEKNFGWHGNSWRAVAKRLEPDDLFCQLDADDEYKPEFLSHMLAFQRENRLDIAACGTDFLDARTKQKVGERSLTADIVIEGRGFSDYFTAYHQFMRTMWGKLIRAELLQKFDPKHTPPISYGGDTRFGIEIFRLARRVGVSAENLHRYFWSPKTLSYRLDSKRAFSTEQLYLMPRQFLTEKCGCITRQNDDFLLRVYFNDLNDSLSVILGSDAPNEKKLGQLLELLEFEGTERLMLLKDDSGEPAGLREKRDESFDALIEWMLSLEDVPDEQVERFCQRGQLLCAVRERGEAWQYFEEVREQFRQEQGQTGAPPEEAGT